MHVNFFNIISVANSVGHITDMCQTQAGREHSLSTPLIYHVNSEANLQADYRRQ